MKTEILAPAGDEQTAYIALNAGADAVYLGLRRFSARSSAENFGAEELARITTYAHLLGAKVYVALNTLVKDSELADFFSAARIAWNAGADAILMQDIFLGRELKRRYPEIVLHLSTQAGCCNVHGAKVAKDHGFSRVVLARETPIEDIRRISEIVETEVFVQGALCTCFSGQCYLSSFAGGNSGNRGKCKQPCRKKYSIDRAGYENAQYALSTSDLHLGKRLPELLAAGVSSLKIEGRMRRPEYVAAAVQYYRALLAGKGGGAEFTRLVRSYNRGDYTEGLGFGQKQDFLSRNVQGHIGEKIGTVSLVKGKPFVKTNYVPARGDGFKILRQGSELCGAVLAEQGKDGFRISAKERLEAGDEVRLTTSVTSNVEALALKQLRSIEISVRMIAGKRPRAAHGAFVYEGEEPLAEAKNAPLSEEEIAACFQKTDGLPLLPKIQVETQGAFLPKSAMNAFRRAFYAALVEHLAPAREPLAEVGRELNIQPEKGTCVAEIGDTVSENTDIFIYKPHTYTNLRRPGGAREVYLYLPPFFTGADGELVKDAIPQFDGIFCEGYYGIELARQYGVKLFAGTGFNITNRYAAVGVQGVATYFALSKEISRAEADVLSVKGAFVLAGGDIKVMELCYCPFERTCLKCDKRDFYRLTDEDGRVFPMRRYRVSGDTCRFELFNCAYLQAGTATASRLYDNSAQNVRPKQHTRGHFERSML